GCSIFHTGKQHRRPGRSATEKFEISDAIGNNKEWLPGHAASFTKGVPVAKVEIRIVSALNQRQSCGRVFFSEHHVAFPHQSLDDATKRRVEIARTDRCESTTSGLPIGTIAGRTGGCRKSGGHQSRGQVRQRRVSPEQRWAC
ncbi:MAG: hypothetical protein WAO83_11405, partial [Fuerstiella sp.]